MDAVDRAAVRGLVQQRLGCACPDSVFDRIDARAGRADEPFEQVIYIGNRLLLLLGQGQPEAELEAHIETLLAWGKRERDRLGFNRLRLVLLTADPERIEPTATAAFRGLALRDERTHLHVLGELPWGTGQAAAS